MKKAALFVMAALLFALPGCQARTEAPELFPCRVVLEEGEGFTAQTYTGQTAPGGELRFALMPEDGYTVAGADLTAARWSGSRGAASRWCCPRCAIPRRCG